MRWKSDRIEQFVEYKILHPQQSIKNAQNYESQVKHNQHLDSLYKELNKYKSQQNHYKSQLHRLNRIAFKQVVENLEQCEMIDIKIEQLKQKKSHILERIKNKQDIQLQEQALSQCQQQNEYSGQKEQKQQHKLQKQTPFYSQLSIYKLENYNSSGKSSLNNNIILSQSKVINKQKNINKGKITKLELELEQQQNQVQSQQERWKYQNLQIISKMQNIAAYNTEKKHLKQKIIENSQSINKVKQFLSRSSQKKTKLVHLLKRKEQLQNSNGQIKSRIQQFKHQIEGQKQIQFSKKFQMYQQVKSRLLQIKIKMLQQIQSNQICQSQEQVREYLEKQLRTQNSLESAVDQPQLQAVDQPQLQAVDQHQLQTANSNAQWAGFNKKKRENGSLAIEVLKIQKIQEIENNISKFKLFINSNLVRNATEANSNKTINISGNNYTIQNFGTQAEEVDESVKRQCIQYLQTLVKGDGFKADELINLSDSRVYVNEQIHSIEKTHLNELILSNQVIHSDNVMQNTRIKDQTQYLYPLTKDFTFQYQAIIQKINKNINSIKSNSFEFQKLQLQKLHLKQNQLSTKENQITKEIQQLESKVAKTEMEILKKTRKTF